jgi:GGDEF domain-containing protein
LESTEEAERRAMKSQRYAENTKVPATQTIAEIPVLLARYGGDRFQHIVDGTNNRAIFQFAYSGLTISFGFPLGWNQHEHKRIYRAVKLAIQGKLESVASGIESPAQAFMAHIVTDDGHTLFERARGLLLVPISQ